MKYIVVGLGAFGGSLAEKLANQGNEVIGVDTNMDKVEVYKEKVSHTICMDCTDEIATQGLPVKDTDVVIVTIGEDQGANILATAIFKNLNAKRVISRAADEIHEKVLRAIGITEIVDPEEETAERWSKKLCLADLVDSYELDENYSMIEANVPDRFDEKTVAETNLLEEFNILVLTTIRKRESRSLLGSKITEERVQGVANSQMKLRKGDTLVLFGSNKDIHRFMNQK